MSEPRVRCPLPARQVTIALVLLLGLTGALVVPPAAVAAPPSGSNRPPVIEPIADQTSAEGEEVRLQVRYHDPSGYPLRIEAQGLPAELRISETGLIHGTLSYASAGRTRVTVTVTQLDGRRRSSSTRFWWTVRATNRPPVLEPIGEQQVAAGNTATVELRASDPDGDLVTLSATGLPSFATFVPAPGRATLTLAPTIGQEGAYPLLVTASDGRLAATESVDIVVTTGGNRAPTIEPIDAVEMPEGTTASVTIVASDPDGDELTAELTLEPAAPGLATLSPGPPGGWRLDLTPDLEAAGTYQVSVTVSDGQLTATASFLLVVTATNRAPELTPIGDLELTVGQLVDLTVEARDPDGDVLSFAASGLPAALTIDPATGRITGTVEQVGGFPVEVMVSDGPVTTRTGFTITVVERPPDEPAGQRIDLRVLLVGVDGTEPSLLAWQEVLRSRGVAYDVHLADRPLDPRDLTPSEDHARYQAVVVATSAVWATLDGDSRAAIDELQHRFGVRKVTSYIYPSATYGLTPPTRGGTGVAEGALTEAGRAVLTGLAGPVPFEGWAWGYEGAVPLDPAAFTTLVAGADGSSLVGVVHHADGREELVSTVDMNPAMIHARLLLPGMLDWVTRGVSTSYARSYLALHIDDVLLDNDRWDPDTNTTRYDGPDPIRMTSTDVDRALDWQTRRGIVLDLVFNGLGTTDHGPNDPLTTHLLTHRDRFRWINHTYTHRNLDTVDQATITAEITDNLTYATTNAIPHDPTELVTGEHSGLTNPALPAALTTTGVRWIASDNSRTPTQQPLGPALTVPRHPTNLYYNTATRAEQLDEYNWIYHDGCVPIPGVHTCLDTPATWERYVDAEATIMLGHLLTNDPRPHYLHQSNLAEDGVMYDVVDTALDRYHRLLTTPLTQPTLTHAGTLLHDHTDWWALVVAGGADSYLLDGHIHLVVARPTRVPVTGTSIGELHRGHRSGWVDVQSQLRLPVEGEPGYGPLESAPTATVTPLARAPEPTESPAPLPLAPAPTREELEELGATG